MRIKTIAIYRAGLLGDTLVSIPVLSILRNSYPDAKLIYIWQKYHSENHVSAKEVLQNSGLVDEFLCDVVGATLVNRLKSLFKIWWNLINRKVDLGIVLEESHWSSKRKVFLRLCNIKIVLGPDGKTEQLEKDENGNLRKSKHISDSLIDVLQPLGVDLPGQLAGNMSILNTTTEKNTVDLWLKEVGLEGDNARKIAVMPWSNMPLKRWPLTYYSKVIRTLIGELGIIPIIFGGSDEQNIADKLLNEWGCGYSVAGKFGIKESIELLRRCKLYIGNDTGTMHMAVVAGIPCVAIFSSRDMPGRWEPYGSGHTVFRAKVDCEGCMLRECTEEKKKCILSIKPENVIGVCREMLYHTS